MKHKKAISLLLIICLALSLMPGLGLSAQAVAAPSFTMSVMGKDGETAAWSESWYFKRGTLSKSYLDADLTKNSDGSGGSFPLLRNFDSYPGFEEYGTLLYGGTRNTTEGRKAVWACCRRGILIEELIDYVEAGSGFAGLRTGGLKAVTTDNKVFPYSTEPVKYSDYYWGDTTRYYFPNYYQSNGDTAYRTKENGIEVPAVLAMVGYYKNEYDPTLTLSRLKNTADTTYSLRLFFGLDYNDPDDSAGAGGSAQNVQNMIFYPEYRAITLAGGQLTGTEGSEDCRLEGSGVSVKSGDGWFRAAVGETVRLTISAGEGGTVSAFGTESGERVSLTFLDGEYTFTMPGEPVTLRVSDGGSSDIGWYTSAPDAEAYTLSTEAQLRGLAEIVGGTAVGEDGRGVAQFGFEGRSITLGGDIELLERWKPIGSYTYPFEGSFNGGGHTVSGVKLGGGSDFQGFFGNNAGTVEALCVSGDISGGSCVGGIAGYNSGTISGCGFVSGSVTGEKSTGGIAGESSGSIDSCAFSASVTGADSTGGIVGTLGAGGTVSGCISRGSVSAPGGVKLGGICGAAREGSTIEGCLSVGSLTPCSSDYAPVCGYAQGEVRDCVSLEGALTDGADVNNGEAMSAEELRSEEAASRLGFAANAGCFPVLKWETASGHTKTNITITTDAETGAQRETYTCGVCGLRESHVISDGSCDTSGMDLNSEKWDGWSVDVSWYLAEPGAGIHIIDTAAKLAGAAAIVNGLVNDGCRVYTGSAVLSADEWNNSDYVNTASGAKGKNNQSSGDYCYGVDDFSGKTLLLVSDLDMTGGNYMPLGGQYLMKSEDETTKIGSSFCGVFDGGGCSVTIKCDRHSTRSYGNGQAVGLIGRLGVHDNDPASLRPKGAAVKNVAVYGSVYANRSVGGIVGKIGKTDGGAVISGCANFAEVTGTDSQGTGGICGSAFNGGEIKSCYNSGKVENLSGPCGGIAGLCEISVTDCYNAGTVRGENAAAIANENGGGSYVNCYYLSGTASSGVNGAAADQSERVTAEQLRASDMPQKLGDGFDADRRVINSGYPVLSWQNGASVKNSYYVELSTVCEVSNGTAEVSFSLTSAQNGLRAAEKANAAGLRAEAKTDEKNILLSVFRFGADSAEVIAASGKPLALVGAGGGRIELSQELLWYFSGSRRLYIHFDPIFTVLGYDGERQSGEITATVRELTDDELRGQLEAAGVLTAPALTYAYGLFYTVSTDANSLLCSGGVTVDIPVSPRFYESGARYTVVHTFAGVTQVLSGECVSKDGSLYVEVQTDHPGYFTAVCENAQSAAA